MSVADIKKSSIIMFFVRLCVNISEPKYSLLVNNMGLIYHEILYKGDFTQLLKFLGQ